VYMARFLLWPSVLLSATLAQALVVSSGGSASRLRQQRARMALAATQHVPAGSSQRGERAGENAVYFIMGGPGSGKGTQCARLVEHFDATHLSAGDLLRSEVASGSEQGSAIAAAIADGQIVASETTVALLQAAMAKRRGPFLVDGFPRSLANLAAFEVVLAPCVFMLFLEVGEEAMMQRLLKRGESSGRCDDNEATIRKRFRTYLDESMPVVEALEARGLVRRVSAEGSADAVFAAVLDAFADQRLGATRATG